MFSLKFRFVVQSVVDEHFFVVQSVNEQTLRRVTSLLDPTIFPCGTYKSLRWTYPTKYASNYDPNPRNHQKNRTMKFLKTRFQTPTKNILYSEDPNTGLVWYSNGRFCLVLGIWLPDHSKTRQICPVLKWSAKLNWFIQKYFLLCIKQSRLAEKLELVFEWCSHSKTRQKCPVFKWSRLIYTKITFMYKMV
jgi:hypothetical protein